VSGVGAEATFWAEIGPEENTRIDPNTMSR
jgi:hypothetical protein